MKREVLLPLFLVASLSVFTRCSEEPAQVAEPEIIVIEEEEIPNEEFDFFLPSTMQIAHILKKSGVLYEQGLTNDPEKYSQYQTRAKRLLNLGVYTGDLAYCILNDQNQEGMKYVDALKKLGNELDMAEVYQTSEALDKMQETVANHDSLVVFIIDTQEKLNDFAYNSQQQSLLLETFTGAWVETVYIGANAENKHPKFMHKRLAEQMGILENLIMGLEMTNNDNEELQDIILQLIDFQNSMPAYQDDFNSELSAEQFEILKQKITSIRNNITNS